MEQSHIKANSGEPQKTMKQNPLSDEWCLWAHLPHDTDWSLNSYKKIFNTTTAEEVIAINDALPSRLVKNCMLFMMRKGVTPLWEDPKNRQGGCFSYKVPNKNVYECWRSLIFSLTGETLSENKTLQKQINGITISPKKNFCIVKIWFNNTEYQDPSIIAEIDNLSLQGCLFKKHQPES